MGCQLMEIQPLPTSELSSLLLKGMIMHARLFKCKETENIRALIVYEDGSVGLWDVSNRALEIRLKTHQDAGKCSSLKQFHFIRITYCGYVQYQRGRFVHRQ